MEKKTAHSAPPIDRAAILDHLEGDVELLREIVTIYLETYPGLVSGIRNALAGADSEALYQAAHKLKGAVIIFQPATVLEPLLYLEAMARKGDLSTAEAALCRLEAELQGLTWALAALFEEPVPPPASEDSRVN